MLLRHVPTGALALATLDAMGHDSRDRACVEIGERIVTGKLAAGAVLDESTLAVEVGVEAPAVREALCFLQRDGFVREVDDGGFAVSELDEIDRHAADGNLNIWARSSQSG